MTRSEAARRAALARWSRLDPWQRWQAAAHASSFRTPEVARRAGAAGGKARAKLLTPAQRSAIAHLGALARWGAKSATQKCAAQVSQVRTMLRTRGDSDA